MAILKPILGLMRCGDWGQKLTPKALVELLAAAVDLGIDTLDLADIYGNHSTNALLGDAFVISPELRQKFKLVAKIGIVLPTSMGNKRGIQYYDLSPEHLQKALDETRRALNVEKLDTLMLHRFDALMKPAETSDWLNQQRNLGSFASFAVSNFDAHALPVFDGLQAICANQIELSLQQSSALTNGTHIATLARGATVQAWSPLGGGELLATNTAAAARIQPILSEICAELELDAASALLRWVASVPSTQIVVGSTRADRLRDAVAACATPLPHDAWYALWEAARGFAVP